MASSRDVIVGVRPEDLEPVGAGLGGLHARPSRAEDGGPRIVARLDPATGARPGIRMSLGAESARVYLFDAASGGALAGAVATSEASSRRRTAATTATYRSNPTTVTA